MDWRIDLYSIQMEIDRFMDRLISGLINVYMKELLKIVGQIDFFIDRLMN